MKRLGLVLMIIAGFVACGSDHPLEVGGPTDESPTDTAGDPVIYWGRATVLEDTVHGPQLCGAVAESYPPQCSGPDVIGWEWDAVEDFDRASGTTWGFYEVTGTWDGTSLTLTETPIIPEPLTDAELDEIHPKLRTACPAPAGGWAEFEDQPERLERLEEALRYAQEQPEFGGIWVSYPDREDESDEPSDPNADADMGNSDMGNMVYNVSFTADWERHETEMTALWGGPLCVTQASVSEAELQQRLDEMMAEIEGWTGASANGAFGTVTIDVYVDQGYQAAADARYGPDAIQINALLRPVDEEGS